MNVVRQPVSSPTESLILVDEQDRAIGFCPKAECHEGRGLLHRAFSVFLFNRNGELLLQKRSANKPLWPLYWSNSCCSHPRESETIEAAGQRRIHEELHIECTVQFLYKFKYQASFEDLGSEHELCHVFSGYTDNDVIAHPEEIAEWRFISPEELTREIAADSSHFTPWLKLEWQQICADHLDEILAGITS
jgi:isopentenyl-diphosphate delta-isomerase